MQESKARNVQTRIIVFGHDCMKTAASTILGVRSGMENKMNIKNQLKYLQECEKNQQKTLMILLDLNVEKFFQLQLTINYHECISKILT